MHDYAFPNRIECLFPDFFGGPDAFPQTSVIQHEGGHRRQVFQLLLVFIGEVMRRAIAGEQRAQYLAADLERSQRHIANTFSEMEGKVLGWKLRIYADAFEDDGRIVGHRAALSFIDN